MKKLLCIILCFVIILPLTSFTIAFAASEQITDITKGWYWPLDAKYQTITSPYAQKRSNQFHQGIDIGGAPEGQADIYAARDGIVKHLGYDSSMGNYVCIYHGKSSNGLEIYSTYMHMYSNSICVAKDQQVTGGKTKLGKVGNTGKSGGTHLHFHISQCDSSDYKPSPKHITKKQLDENYINCSPSYINYNYAQGISTLPSVPSISMTSYPKNIQEKSSFGLRGTIESNGLKTTVKTTVLNSKGKTILSTSDTINAGTTGNVKEMNANKKITFDKLTAGKYTLKIIATNSKGTKNWSSSFTVNSSTNSPLINITSYPTNIKKGSSFGLRGTINSNGLKTTVKTTVLNSKGKTILSTSDTINAGATGNVKNMNANRKIIFNNLSKGTYTLKFTATNKKGSKNWIKSFTVK